MTNNEFKAVNAGSIPLLIKLTRLFSVKETVDAMIETKPHNNTKITPGQLVESLIVATLSGQRALWTMEGFWSKQDLDYLYPGINANQFNDDAYGRMLDKLAEIDQKQLVSDISLNILRVNNLDLEAIHEDTTSKSVQGLYEGESHGEFDLKRGHSKDHRPDLKQLKFGVGVQQDGLIMFGEVLAGNVSDKCWNPQATIEMKDFFTKSGYRNVVFVSDSALISTDALKNLKQKRVQFISRFPETYNLANKLKEEAFSADMWQRIGQLSAEKDASQYKIYCTEKEIEGATYQFVVTHSSALEAQKRKTIAKKLDKEKERLGKESQKLAKKNFACEADALAAFTEFEKSKKYPFPIENKIKENVSQSYLRKGRPLPNQKAQVKITCQLEISIGDIAPEYLEIICQKEGTFILIASVNNHTKYNGEGILREYKHQIKVEQKFKFLKNPVYIGPIYLESKKRVEALGYILILALIIASYLEWIVRKTLKEQNIGIKMPNGEINQRPSITTILDMLKDVLVCIINNQRMFPGNQNEKAMNIIRWAGFDPESLYLLGLQL